VNMRTRNSRREFSGDIPERKEAEDIIRNIAQGVLTSVGEEFFDSLRDGQRQRPSHWKYGPGSPTAVRKWRFELGFTRGT
jgi:hypothetical protein